MFLGVYSGVQHIFIKLCFLVVYSGVQHIFIKLCFLGVYSGVQHIFIKLYFCFVFLRLVYHMLAVCLHCPFFIAPSVYSNVYL